MLKKTLSLLAPFLLGVCFVSDAETPKRIIWITIDTLRADHLHYMGYERETSPWIDQFAKQSIDFRRAFAPSNVTPWSVSSFFTSKYPRDLVDKDPPLHLPRNETTIAEMLQSAGFKTHAYMANVTLRLGLGFEQGFDDYNVILPKSHPHASIDDIIHTLQETYKPSTEKEFIYIQTMDVHNPWQPPMPFDSMFAPDYQGGAFKFGRPLDVYKRNVLSSLPYHSEVHSMTEADTKMAISQYDGLIRYTDDRFEKMLQTIHYNPEEDVVIITSDHGEAFFEHGYLEHGRFLFPEETHVPLLIRVPGIAPAQQTHAVSLLDILPTIADLFDLTPPKDIIGVSLISDLKDDATPERYVIVEHSHRAIPAAIVVGDGYLYSMNGMAHFRYPWRLWPFMEGLYNLDKDPLCLENLIDSESEIANRYNQILREQDSKFAPYTRDHLIEGDTEITFGPNLLPPGSESWRRDPKVTQTAQGLFSVKSPQPLLFRPVEIKEPGHAYLIELEYKLISGVLRLKLQDTPYKDIFRLLHSESAVHDSEIAWDYPVHHKSDDFKRVQAIIYPWEKEMYFVATMEKPGAFELRSISLRRAYVPEIPDVPAIAPPPDPLNRTAPARLNKEWIERLNALGYVLE